MIALLKNIWWGRTLLGATVVLIGFFTDVLYAWLDPRIRLGGRG